MCWPACRWVGLDEYVLVEVMRAARRLTAWAESLELAAIADLDRRRPAGRPVRGVDGGDGPCPVR